MTEPQLEQHYEQLYKHALETFKTTGCQFDSLLDSPKDDDRRGMTLLTRPSLPIKERIQKFLSDFRAIEPAQHYYPDSDIHVTIMSIITCYSGFTAEQIELPRYVELIESCLCNLPEISIHFRGTTASPSCIMVQGFPDGNSLNQLREHLRTAFKNSTLQQSLDKRYPLCTAHTTVIRFRQPLLNVEKVIHLLEHYRDYDFGTFRVNAFELVYNDWYQRAQFVRCLHRFTIRHL